MGFLVTYRFYMTERSDLSGQSQSLEELVFSDGAINKVVDSKVVSGNFI
jgi:hypothetical protein